MKQILFSIALFFSSFLCRAQIAAVEVNKGAETSGVTDVIIVFKMHFDIGYTDWSEGILQKYKGPMLRQTLSEIEKTYNLPKAEQFIWTVPGWPLKYILENCPEGDKEALNKALRTGRITPHSLPVTFQTEGSDLETLVRGLRYSDQIRKNAGRELSRDAKLTDVPSHSHVIPTLLKNAGIDFLHIGCNPGSKSPDIPTLCFWEGTDGKRILLMNWAEYYGSGVLPPKNWPHKTWLAMIHTHENSGAPTAEEVAALLKEAKEKLPNANIRIGELKDFHDALMLEHPNLPVIKGDMPDSWIHGYSSNPKATKLARTLHRTTYATEALENMLTVWGVPMEDHTREYDNALENQVLYDEHTFGIATTHGDQQNWAFGDKFQIAKSFGEYDYSESSWTEKQNRINTAERIVKPILRNAMRTLATHVAASGKRIVVYNPEPWKRSDRVKIAMGVYMKNFTVYALKDLATGEIIPAHDDDYILSFDAKEVPPTGYKTYEAITVPQSFASTVVLDSTANTIENRFFKITVNPERGTLCSVYDKINQKELVDGNSEYGFCEYVHEFFGNEDLARYNKAYVKKGAEGWANQEMGRPYTTNDKRITEKGKTIKLNYEQMSNGGRISVFGKTEGDSPEHYILSYQLYAEEPYVDVNCGINAKAADARPQAAWLAMPFAVDNPSYRVLRIGGIVDPTCDFIDYTNHYYYYINSSIALFDTNQSGVALDAPDAPGISLDSTGLFKFGKRFIPQTAQLFANLYNTQWGTNFTEWVEGSFNLSYRIRSFAKYNAEESLTTPSEESRTPLFAAFSEAESGTLPTTQSGIEISEKGIYLTAVIQNENTLLIRLWEQTGENKTATITIPKPIKYKKATVCNLRGEPIPGQSISIKENKITVKIDSNAPLTLVLN